MATEGSTAYADVYQAAKVRWEGIITGDIGGVYDLRSATASTKLNYACNGDYPYPIDDNYVCAKVVPIDGVGQVLGSAGVVYINSNKLPIAGYTKLDVDDIPNLISAGTFDDVVMHEIGHLLGIRGTTWGQKYVVGANGIDFNGTNAVREYRSISGCANGFPPIEQDGGAGTAGSHWDDYCFKTELMTGYLGGTALQPISTMTIGSLQDIGYQVDYTKADPYTKSKMATNCTCTGRRNLRPVETKVVAEKKRPDPSAKGKANAIAHGKKELAKAKAAKGPPMPGLEYVADKEVSVMYIENGNIYVEHVTPDS